MYIQACDNSIRVNKSSSEVNNVIRNMTLSSCLYILSFGCVSVPPKRSKVIICSLRLLNLELMACENVKYYAWYGAKTEKSNVNIFGNPRRGVCLSE